MTDGLPRRVALELIPETLQKIGGDWLIVAEQSWSWMLWRNDSDQLVIGVMCGSVGLWEEWIELDSEKAQPLLAALDDDRTSEISQACTEIAHNHPCDGSAV